MFLFLKINSSAGQGQGNGGKGGPHKAGLRGYFQLCTQVTRDLLRTGCFARQVPKPFTISITQDQLVLEVV